MSTDAALLLWINQAWADPGLDFLFQWVSERASFSMPLLLILLFVFWRRFAKDGVKLWLLMILGVVLADMLGNLLKDFFAQPRPCYELFELLRPLGGGIFKQCDAATSGMPSSHALNFFSVALFVTLALRNLWLSLVMFGIAVLVGLSRIYLGKHYPSQVAAGASLGLLFGFVWLWLGLHAHAFGRRILSGEGTNTPAPDLVQGEKSRFDPMAWLSLGRCTRRLAWTMPAVWLPLLLGLFLTLLLWLSDLNQPLFLFLNTIGIDQSDRLWASLTLLGDTLVAFTLMSLFLRNRLDIIGALFIAAVFATLWAQGLKPLVDHPRPLALLGSDNVYVIGQALKQHSFPSGHTTTAFTLAGVIILRGVHPLLALGVLVLALLAGVSRAVVGAHWPLDISVGMLGGWLSATLGVWLAEKWPLKAGPRLRLWLILFFMACALALLLTRQLGYPQAIDLQMLIGLAALGYLLSLLPETLRNLRE